MDLVVYQKFSIVSPLPPGILQEKLEKEISRPVYGFKGLFSRSPNTVFSGKIQNARFKMMPVTSGRNSFLPWINGSIVPYLAGSLVSVKLTMHPIVGICIIAWAGVAGWATVSDLNKKTGDFTLEDFLPLGVVLIFIAFAVIEFNRQSDKAKNTLLEIIEGDLFRE